MDKVIEIKINGSHLTRDSQTAGVQHEGNATVLRMEFDAGWDAFAKTVTFWNARGENPVKRILTTDLLENMMASSRIYRCPIPPEAMTEAGKLSYIIDGMADGVRQRSVEDQLKVLPAGYEPEAGASTDPTPTQAEQLQVQVDALRGEVREGILSGERAKASEVQAKASADAAAASERAAGESRQAAQQAATNAAASQRAAADSEVKAESAAKRAEGAVTGVTSFNGRGGHVMPQAGDYTADMVGAVKVYRSFEELGLTEATATPDAIVNAMGDFTILRCYMTDKAMTCPLAAPFTYGLLTVTRLYASFTEFRLTGEANSIGAYGYYNTGAIPTTWSGWLEPYSPYNKPTAADVGAVNPNLLDNWYFADPIDQRGGWIIPAGFDCYADSSFTTRVGYTTQAYKVIEKTDAYVSYDTGAAIRYSRASEAVRGYTGAGYTIDRWKINGGSLIIDNGVLFSVGYVMSQITEFLLNDGITRTFSYLTVNGLMRSCKLTTSYTSIGNYRVCCENNIVHLQALSGAEELIAVKLELGTQQTLARQNADGTWVLNDAPPNKQMELLKCCMSTADSSDKYANNKKTADVIGAVQADSIHTRNVDILTHIPTLKKSCSLFGDTTITNMPYSGYWMIEVTYASRGVWYTVEATDIVSGRKFYNALNNSTWSGWDKIPQTAADVGAVGCIKMIDHSSILDIKSVYALKSGSYSWIQATKLAWQPPNTPDGDLRVVLTVDSVPEQSYTFRLRYIDGATNLREYYGEDNGGTIRWSQLTTTDTALMRDGSNAMTGNLTIEREYPAAFVKEKTTARGIRVSAYPNKQNGIENYKDGSNYRGIRINTEEDEWSTAAQIVQMKAGQWSAYNILHTGNKPSDSYTGNGEGTVTRAINTGGIGAAVLVWSANGTALVNVKQPIIVTASGVTTIGGATFNPSDGKMYLTTAHEALNANGVTYNYQVL